MIFKCRNCGGSMVYSPEKLKMYCEHCDSLDSESVNPGGAEMTTCVNCGAPIEVKQYTSATKCGNCGCYCVFEERVSGEYKPHLILPFKIGKEKCINLIKEHFDKSIFIPDSFLSNAMLNKVEGDYVPFWLYDYDSNCDYVGEGTKIRRWVTGNVEHTETSYFSIVRNIDSVFEKIPVDASYEMDDTIMDLMEPYSYNALENFDPKYMAGFNGDIYNDPCATFEPRAEVKAKDYTTKILQSTIEGYSTVVDKKKNISLNPKEQNYALLPVWVYSYAYGQKEYKYYINGESGKLVGEAPLSKGKIAFYAIALFVITNLILFYGWMLLEVL